MKKMFTVLALGAALMFSLSASAMSPLTDHELATVRGSGQPVAGSVLIDAGTGATEALLKNRVDSTQLNATSQTDNYVNAVTTRSGVSITFDVTMNLYIDVIAWGDADGLGTSAASKAGYAGLSRLNVTGLRMRTRN